MTQRDILVEGLQNLLKQRQLTDVILVARGKELSAHRAVLAASSTFFERLFLGGFCEAGLARVSIDYDPIILDLIIKDIYNEHLPHTPLSPFVFAKAKIYFGIKKYDPKSSIPYPSSSATKEEANQTFKELIDFIDYAYPEGIPQDVIDKLASRLTPGKNRPDLFDYSDDLIIALLISPEYLPGNLLEVYELIKELVEMGHSSELFALLNYDKFPPESRVQLSPEFLALYNKGGPHPRLESPILLVAETPERIGNGFFSTKFIDDFGRIWNGNLGTLNPPQLGDIGSGHITLTFPNIPQNSNILVTGIEKDVLVLGVTYLNPFGAPKLVTVQRYPITDYAQISSRALFTISYWISKY